MTPNQTPFDPNKQTYLDYLTQLSGNNATPNQSTFPAETNGQPIQQTPAPAPKPPAAPAGNLPSNILGTTAVAQQAQHWLPSASTAAPAAAPAAGAPGAAMSFSPTGATAMSGGADAISAGGAQAGIAPATPIIGPFAAGAAGLGATAAGRDFANQHGAAVPWAAANTMNPFNQGIEMAGNAGRVASGKEIDNSTALATALPTGGLSLAYNPLFANGRGVFGSSKGKNQVQRDEARSNAVKNGWFDNNFQTKLGDGSTIDIGKDGGFKYDNPDGSKRSFNNYDENDPLSSQGIGWLRPLGAVLGKGDKNMTDSFTAQLYNEVTKGGDVKDMAALRKKVVDLYNVFKLKPSIVRAAIEQMPMSDAEKNAAYAALDNLKPGAAPQLKPGEKLPATGASIGTPKDPNMQPMGTGATSATGAVNNGSPGRRPEPKTSEAWRRVERRA